MVIVEIINEPIESFQITNGDNQNGAELVFNGKVKPGEISIHIIILSKHRKEAINAMDWFIFELKKNVPIWKWAILKDGKKVPSDCIH